jgi:LysM repeat protein/ABC-type branched-subunit amino acid transport system substrate-binding protein
LIFFITLSWCSFGQFQPVPVKKSNNQISINGKNYYLHEVLKCQTLFGIAKEYQVTEEEVKTLNPELNQKAVYPGMVLRIPELAATKSQVSKTEAQYITRTVLPKDNLYSISRQYGVKVDDIRELNPESKGGLKTGQIIKIPKEKVTIAQKALVSADKSQKASSGNEDLLKEEEKPGQPCRIKPFPHENDNFRVAILLPLNINQNDTLVYSDTLKADHFRFYEFLEGIYLAIDSMRLSGMNLTVEVFDTERDTETIKTIIKENNLEETDLIIGPVFKNEIEVVSAFSRSKHIPMVSPLSTFDVVKGNPEAFQVRNLLPRQIELASAYLASKYEQNLIVVGRLAEKRSPEFTRFLTSLGTQVKELDPAKKAGFKTIYFSETSRNYFTADSVKTDLIKQLSASKQNYIIITSENKVFITEIINELNENSATYKLNVFGLNQWVFEDLELGNLYGINLELYSDFEDYPFVDYTEPGILNFCSKYRKNWNIEPTKYSFQGFDVTYYFLTALYQFGRNVTSSVPCWTEYLNFPSMLTPMRFQYNNSTSGYNNQAITIVRFQKEELVRKKVN